MNIQIDENAANAGALLSLTLLSGAHGTTG